MEEAKENKNKKDYLLPASILIGALLISISLVYNAGKSARKEKEMANVANGVPVRQVIQNLDKISPVTKSDRIKGSINAPIKIVEYADLECPFCKRFHFTLENIKSIYGDTVAIVFRHFPLLELHSKALKEAQASECAFKLGGNDAFWRFIGKVFEVTPSNNGLDLGLLPQIAADIGLDKNAFEACLNSDYGKEIIFAHAQNAIDIGAQGTPYSVVMNSAGKKYEVNGAYPLDALKQIIDQAIKENN